MLILLAAKNALGFEEQKQKRFTTPLTSPCSSFEPGVRTWGYFYEANFAIGYRIFRGRSLPEPALYFSHPGQIVANNYNIKELYCVQYRLIARIDHIVSRVWYFPKSAPKFP